MYKICLVEDEESLNDLITAYLKKEGYEVVSCKTGKSALEVTEKIDLWILDIMLGDDISGYDIIKKVREKDTQVPVIFTSARDQELDKIIGLELDADDYITKPYSPKELMLRVNKLIKISAIALIIGFSSYIFIKKSFIKGICTNKTIIAIVIISARKLLR